MKLQEFYNIGKPITTADSPYFYLASKYNLSNYRLYDIQTLVDNNITKNDIADYIFAHIAEQKETLVIFNQVGNVPLYCVARDVEKRFLTMGSNRAIPYGINSLIHTNFHYSQPLVIVEGLKDRDILAQIYPNTVATLTAGASPLMREVLLKITNNFIFLYDNDTAGQKGYFTLKRFFEENNCRVRQVKIPKPFKDVGEILDREFKGDLAEADYLKTLISTSLNALT